MKVFLHIAAFLALTAFASPALAQAGDDPFVVTNPTIPSAEGAVTNEPHCFNVHNRAPYTVYGQFLTNYFTRPDGIRTRHRSNFRLEADNRAEFCTYGPFFEDEKLDLVLKTLVPIFECRTAINEDIVIYGRRKSEGGTETWAVCLE